MGKQNMEKQNIIISTMPVTIKIMEVGGKKMTMSVFKQIPECHFYRGDADSQKESFLGWVFIEKYGRFFVFSIDNILYKWKITAYSQHERENNDRLKDIYKKISHCESYKYQLDKIEALILEKDQFIEDMSYLEMEKQETNLYLNEKNQIYISI
jgi:hypothetical protein